MAYPGYPPLGGNPAMNDPLYGYFHGVAGQDGQIDSMELQRCLTSSGLSGPYQPFSLETCKILICMLDRDLTGKMGFEEFKEMWNVVNQWRTTFATYDRDRSGSIEPNEFSAAIQSFGYRLSPQAFNMIIKRYCNDRNGIVLDQFIAAVTRLKVLTGHFQQRDTARNGTALFHYDDFIQVSMFI